MNLKFKRYKNIFQKEGKGEVLTICYRPTQKYQVRHLQAIMSEVQEAKSTAGQFTITKVQPQAKVKVKVRVNNQGISTVQSASMIEKLDGKADDAESMEFERGKEEENAEGAAANDSVNEPFPSVKNQFRTAMKLEGIDPMHQNLFCVLTVAEVCGYRIRLHFDSYSECLDFWTDVDSGYIFPVGFCEKMANF